MLNWTLIQFNPRKGRYVLRAADENGDYLVKWNDDHGNHAAFRKKLEAGAAFCTALHGSGIAPNVRLENDLVLTEYYAGARTLREAVSNSTSDASIVRFVEDALANWTRLVQEDPDIASGTPEGAQMISRYFYSLLCSGPLDTQQGRLEEYRNKVLFKTSFRPALSSLVHSASNTVRLRTVHGDFHLSNVLVLDDSSTRLIDFEEAGKGVAEAELAYFQSQIWMLGQSLGMSTDAVDRIIAEQVCAPLGLHEGFYLRCRELFHRGIALNTRFLANGRR